MMSQNIIKILKDLGLNPTTKNQKQLFSEMLRDYRWVDLFEELGYQEGIYISIEGSNTATFLIVLPDGNIGSGINEMIPTGFESMCDLVLDDELFYNNNELYKIGNVYEYDDESAIQILTPNEFMGLINIIKTNKVDNINENKNMRAKKTIKLTESELHNIIKESVMSILKEIKKNKNI